MVPRDLDRDAAHRLAIALPHHLAEGHHLGHVERARLGVHGALGLGAPDGRGARAQAVRLDLLRNVLLELFAKLLPFVVPLGDD